MNDQYRPADQSAENPAVSANETIQVPAVQPAETKRRRRTDRNRDTYDAGESAGIAVPSAPEAPMAPVAPAASAASAQEKRSVLEDVKPSETAAPLGSGTTVVPRFQTRYNPTVPSQGVPRPSSLNVQPARRPGMQPSAGTVRRPVNAEGYTPIQPLGASRTSEQETTNVNRLRRPDAQDAARRMQPPVTDDRQYADEEEKTSGGRGLVIAIIALLALAAVIVGLILIPEDHPGVLGQVKRAVTEPLKGLIPGSGDSKNDTPAEASGFTATLAQDTAPYKIVFNLVTSNDVTAVRVVDAAGSAMPTTTTLSYPSNESTIVWVFEMTLETGYEGTVQAQIQDGEEWIDTGLKQTLTIGTSVPPTISSVPVNTVVAATEIPAATDALLTADSSVEPTVSPAMEVTQAPEATDAPTDVPVTDEPVPTAEPTAVVTATPTLSMTATPTMVPTATPTAVPTPEPTEEPTPEPTQEPTPEPTVTPVATPKLEAKAVEKADPSLISTTVIYEGTKEVEAYERDRVINMPAADDYLNHEFGVTTFRGNAFRQNAAFGTVTAPTSLSLAWTAEAGSVAASSRTFYGIGWTGQPVIVKWTKEVRQAMEIDDARKNQTALKEVIVAGQDGKIYFLDLNDGTPTREAINFGFPMRGTPTLHPLGYPLMTVGQYSRFLKDKTGDIGLRYYDLLNSKQLRLIDGLDGKLDRQYNDVGAFDTSALIDRNSNTLIAIGTNGLLYTEALDMALYQGVDGGVAKFEFKDPEQVVMMSHTKKQSDDDAAVESSLAMYGSYAFYADLGGVLRCVDTTTMTTAWAVDTGDAVKAAIALDLDEANETLWLYVANVLTEKNKGDVVIRRFNAMTGEQDWTFAAEVQKKSGKKDSYNKEVTAGAMASPVIGQNGLGDLVYFTLNSLTKDGSGVLTGDHSKALPAVTVAIHKGTGKAVWTKTLDAYCYSSPVAVYDETGKGWLIQACSNGTLYLLDGLTGEEVATLQLNGTIEASPAVYGDTLVIGTTGKGTSYIYGVKIK